MDLKLKPFDFAQAASKAGMADVAQRVQAKMRQEAVGGAEQPSFQASFSNALNSISAAQQKSATMQREVQFDNPTVSLEETMIAMQKAQLGFQSAVQVRNKLVQAYKTSCRCRLQLCHSAYSLRNRYGNQQEQWRKNPPNTTHLPGSGPHQLQGTVGNRQLPPLLPHHSFTPPFHRPLMDDCLTDGKIRAKSDLIE